MQLDPRTVYMTEIAQLQESIQKLEGLVEETQTAIAANKILLAGLEENLASTPEQLEIVED